MICVSNPPFKELNWVRSSTLDRLLTMITGFAGNHYQLVIKPFFAVVYLIKPCESGHWTDLKILQITSLTTNRKYASAIPLSACRRCANTTFEVLKVRLIHVADNYFGCGGAGPCLGFSLVPQQIPRPALFSSPAQTLVKQVYLQNILLSNCPHFSTHPSGSHWRFSTVPQNILGLLHHKYNLLFRLQMVFS